jgi:hypothetical protein
MQVVAEIAQELAKTDLLQRAILLVADENEELVR